MTRDGQYDKGRCYDKRRCYDSGSLIWKRNVYMKREG